MEWLHAGLGWPILALIAGLSFATSFVTAAFGIGGGAIMLAVLAVILPPAALIPVHGLVQLGSNTGRAVMMRHEINLSMLQPFAIGALAGIALGAMVLVELPGDAVLIAVGVFILYTVLFSPPAILARSAAGAGALSSLLTMFVGATGPFVAAFIKAQNYRPTVHVATHAGMMTLQHLLKTLAFGFLGFAFSDWLGVIAILIAAGLAGTYVGRHVLLRTDEARFKRVLTMLLIVLALKLIWDGATGLFAA